MKGGTLADADIDEVGRLVEEADRLQGDPQGFASLLTEDVVLVNAVGRRVIGQAAVREAMAAAMQTPLAGVNTRIRVEDVRRVAADAYLVVCTKSILSEGSATAKQGSTVALSFLVVKRLSGWRIALAHNTLVRE